MPDPIIVRFQPPTYPVPGLGEKPVASDTSTGGSVVVHGIVVCDVPGFVGEQGYVGISPVLHTGKISDATRLYLPREASIALAVKLLAAEGIDVRDLLTEAIVLNDDRLEIYAHDDDMGYESMQQEIEDSKNRVKQTIHDLMTQHNAINAALGNPPAYQHMEEASDDEFGEDDYCACAECDDTVLVSEGESTYCGTVHQDCLSAHVAHCEICAGDWPELVDGDDDDDDESEETDE